MISDVHDPPDPLEVIHQESCTGYLARSFQNQHELGSISQAIPSLTPGRMQDF